MNRTPLNVACLGGIPIFFMFIHELPSKTPDAIIPMEFDGHDHFGFAVFAISSVFVCSVQEDLVEQLQNSR
jgi:hypothetical protein